MQVPLADVTGGVRGKLHQTPGLRCGVQQHPFADFAADFATEFAEDSAKLCHCGLQPLWTIVNSSRVRDETRGIA